MGRKEDEPAMYRPGTLKVSNMTSAVYSLFSGGFRGGSAE